MSKKLIYVMTFILALGSTAQAAVYLWNGSAGDGNWDTILNWTVTDSLWTWPNEEYGTRQVNSDTIAIDILNGDAVSRGSELGIDGAADGSTTGVLTLDNGSSLIVGDDLATSTDPGRRGQIDVLGGSSVTVIGDGNDIRIADDPDTWGMMNIVDSTVDIADDLRLDEGEAYVNISGSSIVNADAFNIADANTAVAYLDISGTAVITLVDDFKIDEGIGTVTIGGDAVINFGDDCYLPDQAGQGTMTLTGNSVFNVGDDMTIADDAGTVGHVIVTGNATLNAPDELYLADAPTAFATLDVNGTATVNIGDDLNIGEDGPGICNIGENATVIVTDDIYVAHNVAEGAFESHMTISGNASLTCGDLIVANNGGLTGYLHISGNPMIHTTGNFYMNDDEGDPAYSQVIMDGGTVTVDGYTTFNDDVSGTAEFIMNGGSFYSTDYLNLSDNLDGIAHLTMNGGEMITANQLRLGKDGGDDIGQVRIFMNGGLLQAEDLDDIMITDTKIIYTGGEIRIRQPFQPDPVGDPNTWWGLSEADMQNLIDNGTIVAEGSYNIVTDGDYTALVTPEPVNPGSEGLVAHYAFENDANDSSGNELHGTIIGDPVFVEGLADYGMALDFDGIDDVVELGKFDVVGQISLAAWVKADDFETNDARIISKANEWGENDHWWMLSTISETGLRFRLKTDDGQNTTTLISDPVLEAGVWAHVAAAWDGSMMRIYKDGVEVASQEKGGSAVAVDPDVSVAIGSQPSDAFASDPVRVVKFFDGLIDEVGIYERSLSEGEVLYLAGKRATPVDPGTDALVAFYPLENDVNDSSGNGNDGTIVGNPTFVEGPAGYGMAMEFHGLGAPGGGGDYIDCGNDASLDITGPISIALWIQPGADDPEGQGTETAPMAKAMDGVGWSWQVRYGWGSPQPYMAFTFNSSPRAWAYVGRNLERDEWCHIACSHDGTTLKCYLNGEQTDSTPMGQITSSEAPVLIGSDGWGCDWIGAIDEVAIYNRDLSGGEVRYLAGYRAPVDPGNEGLVAHWPLDEGAGNTAADIVGGHDGTLKGGVAWAGEGSPVNGDALSFDGYSDGASHATDPGTINWVSVDPFDVVGPGITLAAWIRPEGFDIGDARIITKQKTWSSSDIWWMLSTYTDGTALRMRLKTDDGGADNGTTTMFSDTGYLEAGVWSHVAATYDGSKMRLYHNAVEIMSADKTGAIQTDPTAAVAIGNSPLGDPGGLRATFHGLIDDVRAYSRVLSEPEVRYLAGDD